MKKKGILLVLTVIIAFPLVAQQNTLSGITLQSALDSVCYSIGVSYGVGLGEQMKTFPGANGEPNLKALAEGFVRAITSDLGALLIAHEEAQAYIQSYLTEVSIKEAEEAKEEEVRFLADNKTKEGIISTESGLQYRIVTQGEGEKPTLEDRVTVHFTGALLDGTVFQSTLERGEPLTIGLSEVFSGWSELLQLMPVGSKYVAWIPAELGYGSQGYGQIKPNATLIFEVELLSIEK